MASNIIRSTLAMFAAFVFLPVHTTQAARHLLETPTGPTLPSPNFPPMPIIPTMPQPNLPNMPRGPTLPQPTFPTGPISIPNLGLPPVPSVTSLPNIPFNIPNIPTTFPSIPSLSPPPSKSNP